MMREKILMVAAEKRMFGGWQELEPPGPCSMCGDSIHAIRCLISNIIGNLEEDISPEMVVIVTNDTRALAELLRDEHER